jgi:hypothetical protein
VSVIRLVFVEPIILLLKFLFTQFHAVTGNYGLSLLLMSLAVTLLTTPLYYLAEHWRRIEVELQNKMAPELASVRTHYQGQKRFYLTRNVHRLTAILRGSPFAPRSVSSYRFRSSSPRTSTSGTTKVTRASDSCFCGTWGSPTVCSEL